MLIPLREAGIDIYQSRSLSTSIVYQRQSALNEGRDFSIEQILTIPGNAFCHAHPFDHLIIPTIVNVQEALRRAQHREKDDNCKFENLEFQLKIKPQYESLEFRQVFEKVGTKVTYQDAGKTIEFSQQQAREFYSQHLRK